MTKAEIVSEIVQQTGLERAEVLRLVETFMTTIKSSLSKGENVYLRGFGSFVVKQRAQKTGRNISKNTSIIIPAHNVPAFKPAKTFVEEARGGSVKIDGVNVSFKVVETPNGHEFAVDRGSMKEIDISGITVDRFAERFPPGHGMRRFVAQLLT